MKISFRTWVLIVMFSILILLHSIPSKYSYRIKVVDPDTNIVVTLNGEDIGDVYSNSHDCLRAMTYTLNQFKEDSIIYNSIIVIE